jgi:outer membrane protein assembly factor BamB
VYVGSSDGNVYALRADTGQPRWKVQTGGEIHSSPLLFDDRVIVGADDGFIYAINAESGTLAWKSQVVPNSQLNQVTPRIFSTPVAAQGSIFIGSNYEGSVIAVNPKDGTVSVRSKLGTNSRQLVTASRDGKTILVSSPGPYSVYALSAGGGGPLWKQATGPINTPPQEGTGGIIVVAGTNVVYVFDSSGTPLKNVLPPGTDSIVGEPSTPRDSGQFATGAGRLFVSRTGNKAEGYAIQSDGGWNREWSASPAQALSFSPVLAGSGHLFVSSANGNVAALNYQNGTAYWSKGIDTNIAAKATLGMIDVPNNKWWVFVVSREGRITALDPYTGGSIWVHALGVGGVIDSPVTVD